MPKNTSSKSKDSAAKNTLNPGGGSGRPGGPGEGPDQKPGRNQEQASRDQGQFTETAKPGLQKR